MILAAVKLKHQATVMIHHNAGQLDSKQCHHGHYDILCRLNWWIECLSLHVLSDRGNSSVHAPGKADIRDFTSVFSGVLASVWCRRKRRDSERDLRENPDRRNQRQLHNFVLASKSWCIDVGTRYLAIEMTWGVQEPESELCNAQPSIVTFCEPRFTCQVASTMAERSLRACFRRVHGNLRKTRWLHVRR